MGSEGIMSIIAAPSQAQAVSPSGTQQGASTTQVSGDEFSSMLQLLLSVSPATSQAVAPATADAAGTTGSASSAGDADTKALDAMMASLTDDGSTVSGMSAADFLAALKANPEMMQKVLAAAKTATRTDAKTVADTGKGTDLSAESALALLAAQVPQGTAATKTATDVTGKESAFTKKESSEDDVLSLDEGLLAGQTKKAEQASKNVGESGQKKETTTLTLDDILGKSSHASEGKADASALLTKNETTSASTSTTSGTTTVQPVTVPAFGASAGMFVTDRAGRQASAAPAAAPISWNAYDATQIKTFASELGARITTGSQQVKITMQPEHLGDMTVSVKMDDAQGIKLHVTVDSVQAKALVEQNSASLQSAFGEGGLKLTSLDVNVRDQRQPGQDVSQNTNDGNSRNGSGNGNQETAFQKQERERAEMQRDLSARMSYAGALRGVNFLA